MGGEAENPSKFWQYNVVKGISSEVRSTDNDKKSDNNSSSSKKLCVCSPTTHPGSFRCSLHRAIPNTNAKTAETKSNIGLSRFAKDLSNETENK